MKVIIFDMYGVIIKESMGNFKPYTYEHFPNTDHSSFMENYLKAEMGLITSNELLAGIGFEDADFHMKKYIENYLTIDNEFLKFAEKYEGKYKFALLSNGILEWHNYIMEYYDLKKYFSWEVVSGQVKCRKPDKEIFEFLMNKMGVSREECIYIDNGIRNNLMALSLGIDTILFNGENRTIDNRVYNSKIVNNFRELESIVDNIS